MISMTCEDVALRRETLDTGGADLRPWIVSEWSDGDAWLLGQAFDGVLWGRLSGGVITFGHDAGVPGAPTFRRETLLELRVFNEGRELRLWRVGGAVRGALVKELAEGTPEEVFHARIDRSHPLVGEPARTSQPGFVALRGPRGERHSPPSLQGTPRKLEVRYYFRRDPSGMLRTAEYRLRSVLEDAAQEGV